jgi:LPXTG-motif cell wall-anchored protein
MAPPATQVVAVAPAGAKSGNAWIILLVLALLAVGGVIYWMRSRSSR